MPHEAGVADEHWGCGIGGAGRGRRAQWLRQARRYEARRALEGVERHRVGRAASAACAAV